MPYLYNIGIVANDWVNPETNEVLYCVGDKNAKILGLPKASGRSPRNLIGTTIGDELIMASPKSRVFAASFKDRGAILPAGHLGKAFWYSYSNGEFITSDFYYKEYPEWVKTWNAQKMSDNYRNQQWELAQPLHKYMHKVDVYDFEHGWKHLHKRMPKKYFPDNNIADGNFYGGLMLSPPGDEILLSFAKAMVENERLGKGEVTDFLSVSFSAIGNSYPQTFMHQHILNNFHPKRSGNVYLLPEQLHMWYHKKYADLTANHPYPRTHNTYVPIIFAGNGIRPLKSARLVSPLDIASTIAFWMDIKPTSGNTGNPLVEVLDAYRFK